MNLFLRTAHRIIAGAIFVLTTAAADAAPRVVVTIPPIHSLVAGIMETVGQPELLLRATASPHSYAMRPSDARRLQRADVIFWIDKYFESFLAKPIALLRNTVRTVELSRVPGIHLHDTRRAGQWASTDGVHKPPNAHHPSSEEGHTKRPDFHLWLDLSNAKAIVTAVKRTLSDIDPPYAMTYDKNASRLQTRLDDLDDQMRQILRPILHSPYIVLHDGYQYFEKRYGTNGVGAVSLSPERAPGVKRIRQLRSIIRAGLATCIFAEPQFSPRVIQALIIGTGAPIGTLDPMGIGLPPGSNAYFRLLSKMAWDFRTCLDPSD